MTCIRFVVFWVTITHISINNTIGAPNADMSTALSPVEYSISHKYPLNNHDIYAYSESPYLSFNISEKSRLNASSGNRNPVQASARRMPQVSFRDAYFMRGNLEIGVSAGTIHVVSDIANNKELAAQMFLEYHTNNFDLWTGLFVRYVMNDWFGVRLTGGYSSFSIQPDGIGNNIIPHIAKAENNIFEISGRTEFMIPALAYTPFDVFGFMGIGLFFSNARLYNATGSEIHVGSIYNKVQPFIPVGFGFDAQLTQRLKIGYEFGWRNTLFNYLDGVEVAGYGYDKYFVNQLNLIIRL